MWEARTASTHLPAHADDRVAGREAQAHPAILLLKLADLQPDRAAGGGEFEGVGQQISQHLTEPQGVAHQYGIGEARQGHGGADPPSPWPGDR